jgi:SMI1 / KNR4 family (SUKH-1)
VPSLGERLTVLWRDAGLRVRPGVEPAAIQAFQAKYHVTLPTDMREYFLTINGMEDEFDPGLNRFWPLHMVKPVEDELTEIHKDRFAYPGCFVFVDHCVWCFAWAVRLGKEPSLVSGPVFQVTAGDTPGRQIAPSFTVFVEMYLADQDNIL